MKIVIFSQDTAPIISTIIGKYNLVESTGEATKKMEAGKLFNGGVILNITEKIILNKSLKDSLPTLVEKELNVPGDIAKSVAKEIEEKLLPIGQVSEISDTEIPVTAPQNKPRINPSEPLYKIEIPATGIPKTFSTNLEETLPPKSKEVSNKSDTYREPIE